MSVFVNLRPSGLSVQSQSQNNPPNYGSTQPALASSAAASTVDIRVNDLKPDQIATQSFQRSLSEDPEEVPPCITKSCINDAKLVVIGAVALAVLGGFGYLIGAENALAIVIGIGACAGLGAACGGPSSEPDY